MAKTLTVQLTELLNDYNKEIQDVVDKESKKVAMEGAKTLRSTSPKSPHGGEYAQSWRSKKDGTGYRIYNAKHYRLTHLLENGHVVRNQFGTYGRVGPIKHIKPVEEWAKSEFEERVKKGIEGLNNE